MSSLATHAAQAPASDEQLQALRRASWQHQGVVVVRPAEIRDPGLRAAIERLAEELYGPRKGRA